ncbi:hypothetical protein BT67DRAFT_68865 [Trichocladium antarcticum]|uniref:Uncharacterized protein n=1 Tax=Trichocladium antarcticum TaxID=1450529 RepID=A0AAN6UJV3_9PEZI|nr:hypothetical protein BT67DRAFT_68865 [Trichocladium antarcticum]
MLLGPGPGCVVFFKVAVWKGRASDMEAGRCSLSRHVLLGSGPGCVIYFIVAVWWGGASDMEAGRCDYLDMCYGG